MTVHEELKPVLERHFEPGDPRIAQILAIAQGEGGTAMPEVRQQNLAALSEGELTAILMLAAHEGCIDFYNRPLASAGNDVEARRDALRVIHGARGFDAATVQSAIRVWVRRMLHDTFHPDILYHGSGVACGTGAYQTVMAELFPGADIRAELIGCDLEFQGGACAPALARVRDEVADDVLYGRVERRQSRLADLLALKRALYQTFGPDAAKTKEVLTAARIENAPSFEMRHPWAWHEMVETFSAQGLAERLALVHPGYAAVCLLVLRNLGHVAYAEAALASLEPKLREDVALRMASCETLDETSVSRVAGVISRLPTDAGATEFRSNADLPAGAR